MKELKKKKLSNSKQKKRSSSEISPLEALRFLEDLRTLNAKIDGPKKMISIRIPENLIRLLKSKAKLENTKYQTLIIESIKLFLEQE